MDKKNEPPYHYPNPEIDQRYLLPPYYTDDPLDLYTDASMRAMGPQYQAQYPYQQDIVSNPMPGYNQPNPGQQQKPFPSISPASLQVQHPTQIPDGNKGVYLNHNVASSSFNPLSQGGFQHNSQAILRPTPHQMSRTAPDNPRLARQTQQQSSGSHLSISQSNVGASTSSGAGADHKRKRAASSRASAQAGHSKRQRKDDPDDQDREPRENEASAPEDAPDEPDEDGDEDSDEDIDDTDDEYEDDEDDKPSGKGKGKARVSNTKRKNKKKKKNKADGPGRACVRCKDKNRPCSFVSRPRSIIKKRDVCEGCEEAEVECIHVRPDIPRGPWPGWAHCPRLLELLRQDDEKLLYRWCSQMLLKSHLTPAGFKGTNFDYLKTDEAALTGKGWSLSAMSVAINSGKKRFLPETVTPGRGDDLPIHQGLSDSMVLDPTKTQEKQKMEWKRRIRAMQKEQKDEYDYTDEDGSLPTAMSTPPTRHEQDEYRLVLDVVNRRVDSANDNFKATRDSELQVEEKIIEDWLGISVTGYHASDSANVHATEQKQIMTRFNSDESGAISIPDAGREAAKGQITTKPALPEESDWKWSDDAEQPIDPALPDWRFHNSQYSEFLSAEDVDSSTPFWDQVYNQHHNEFDESRQP